MKKILTQFALLLVVIASMSMTLRKKQRIVFFGDSITQAGVSPAGYISLIQKSLTEKKTADNYELVGAGIGGNKVYDLYLRMEDDVLAKKPDVVVVYVGINDVWHKSSSGTGTDLDKFEKFYNALIKKLQAQNIKVYICTPSVIGEMNDFSNPQDGDLNQYSKTIRKIAGNNGVQLIDLRKAFVDYEVKNNTNNEAKGILTTDRVHLNEKGNQLVADEMMKALGL
ncbi:GDSL-type esterase/lipase family protein [Chitinophaga horti]|uniref:GDSL-type esterase/lipase family protein n=1 Tax=Chitinophaga horti TaxID=2920382 RepID=A0ABY6IYM5_9BACT|nr:GDSL-type esterase/lipase family protein [Chitinophaga horti]UYQ92380.1 GDSL-type esterase/lipase family protein [Chitinophaga horti]